jgi:hypothetical protein
MQEYVTWYIGGCILCCTSKPSNMKKGTYHPSLVRVTPNLGVTKEIMSRGPQVENMECQDPDGQIIAPKGPCLSFDSFYTSPTTATSTTLVWSQNEVGLSPRGNEYGYHGKCHSNI